MKSILKFLGVSTAMILTCSTTRAQDKLKMSLAYRVDVPSGDFTNYVSNPAGRGFNAAVAFALNNKLSIGGNIGYNDFYQKFSRSAYNDGTGNTISAVITNSIQQIPVQAQVNYILTKKIFAHPYVAAGAGFNIIMYDQYLGEFSSNVSKTKPIFNAGAGFYIPFSKYSRVSADIGAVYDYAPFNEAGIKNVNTFAIHAGLIFPIR
jgi:hypothetical protein